MTLCMLQVGEQIEESYVKKHSDAPLLLLISNKTLSCKTFQKGMNFPPPSIRKKKRCINIIELKVPLFTKTTIIITIIICGELLDLV